MCLSLAPHDILYSIGQHLPLLSAQSFAQTSHSHRSAMQELFSKTLESIAKHPSIRLYGKQWEDLLGLDPNDTNAKKMIRLCQRQSRGALPPFISLPNLYENSYQEGLQKRIMTQKAFLKENHPTEEDRAFAAIHTNYWELLQKLLQTYPAFVQLRDRSGKTLLHLAAEKGYSESIQVLLNAEADLSTQDRTTQATPLHLAAQEGHQEALRLLLQRGANVDRLDRSNRTPLHRAALRSLVESDLHTKKETIQQLITFGSNINAQDLNGQTPLHLAAFCNNISAYKALLHLGASVHLQDNKNKTPLDLARQRKHADIIQISHKNDTQINSQQN